MSWMGVGPGPITCKFGGPGVLDHNALMHLLDGHLLSDPQPFSSTFDLRFEENHQFIHQFSCSEVYPFDRKKFVFVAPKIEIFVKN